MPAIFEPGSHGDAAVSFEPSGFRDWHRGAVYTIRPRTEISADRPYRMLVAVRVRIAGELASYAPLYERAKSLSTGRARELGYNSWTESQVWGRYDGAIRYAFAVLTTVVSPEQSGAAMTAPSAEDLAQPFGTMPASASAPTHAFDEIYNDFDFRTPDSSPVVMFSYGEYVPSAEGIDFEPILTRAEHRAKGHLDARPFSVRRREWLFAGDANATQAVVHIYC